MTSISADTIPDVISPEAVFIAACERNEKVRVSAHLQRANYVKREEINCYTNSIPIQNGLFNLLTREITPFDPEQIFTYKLNVSYDPEAQCPKWLDFVKQVVNEEDIPLLQEIMGYCLLPAMPFHKIFWQLCSFHNRGHQPS